MEYQFLTVITTVDSAAEAERIAAELVERHLAACVQIHGPISSTYRWEGEIQQAAEWACHVKTSADLYPAVENAIHELHGYEQPEIVALPIVHAAHGYLQWMRDVLEAPDRHD